MSSAVGIPRLQAGEDVNVVCLPQAVCRQYCKPLRSNVQWRVLAQCGQTKPVGQREATSAAWHCACVP